MRLKQIQDNMPYTRFVDHLQKSELTYTQRLVVIHSIVNILLSYGGIFLLFSFEEESVDKIFLGQWFLTNSSKFHSLFVCFFQNDKSNLNALFFHSMQISSM